MGRREEMVKLAEKMMQNRENIRNIGIVAHIDHGKCIDGKARIALADGRVMTAEEVFQLSALQGKKVRETKNETIFETKQFLPWMSPLNYSLLTKEQEGLRKRLPLMLGN